MCACVHVCACVCVVSVCITFCVCDNVCVCGCVSFNNPYFIYMDVGFGHLGISQFMLHECTNWCWGTTKHCMVSSFTFEGGDMAEWLRH